MDKLLKGCGSGIYSGVQLDDFIYIRHLQNLSHMPFGAGYTQLPTRLLQLPGRHHDDSNSSAVDVSHAGQVKNNLLVLFTHQVVGCPFKVFALAAHCDSPGDLHHHDVRFPVLALNLQHSKPPSNSVEICVFGRPQEVTN